MSRLFKVVVKVRKFKCLVWQGIGTIKAGHKGALDTVNNSDQRDSRSIFHGLILARFCAHGALILPSDEVMLMFIHILHHFCKIEA